MRITFYAFLRRHWRSIVGMAALLLVIVAVASNYNLSILNGLILLYTLIGIVAYTDETHELVTQQHVQFLMSNRPWMYADDISYESYHGGLTIAIQLVNLGRTPAVYEASILNFEITPLFGDRPLSLTPAMDRIGASIVFPFVEGKETRYLVPLYFKESQTEYFQSGCKIELKMKLTYRAITSDNKAYPFLFEATLLVPSFNEKIGIQSTIVNGVIAT